MISFTHCEGYGRPLQEATMVGLPVIASNWSGHLDFLNEEKSLLIPGELQVIPKSVVWKDILIEQSQWFVGNEVEFGKILNYAFHNVNEVKTRAKSLMNHNRNKFSLNDMSKLLVETIENSTTQMPSQVKLKLPKLKKVENSKPPKIKLPKLRKLNGETV